ncbi:hypothetical protein RUM43_002331 [Polyplax serrata]|uniref:Uncharacterized protein n=1 Tax=Polyplax serrata TaxID=468196 RepID=A0AAN8NZ29_POLSC
MTAIVSSFQPNVIADKKSVDTIQKDVKKWVDSVVEFKANLEKKKSEPPLENHLKKIQKFKIKKRPNVSHALDGGKTIIPAQQKRVKTKKKSTESPKALSSPVKSQPVPIDKFDQMKESYRNIKLPQNWTSGVSSGRLVFNRVKITAHNSQQKVAVERSLIITKDCNAHVLISGSEIVLNNWEMQKVDTLDDVKRAIKDIDSLKICEGFPNGAKSPHCAYLISGPQKSCPACKSEVIGTHKQEGKHKQGTTKKQGASKQKAATKQKPQPKT